MSEDWRSLKGIVELGEFYEISSLGNVRNATSNKLLTPYVKKNGYFQIDFRKKSIRKKYYIHRLVALAFIANPENKGEVNHKNGNKSDNTTNNLEWVTHKENLKHSHDIGLHNQLGSENHMAALTENDVLKIKELYSMNKCRQSDLAERFHVSRQTINNILHGKVWSHVIFDGEIKIHSGRQGEYNHQSKLTENDVKQIKKLYETGEYSIQKLGEKFGVSRGPIQSILTGKSWSHVE